MINIKLALVVFGILLSSSVQALDLDSLQRKANAEQDLLPQRMITIQSGYNCSEDVSNASEVDFTWYAWHYAGVGFGIEFDDNHGKKSFTGSDDNEYDPDRIVKLNFHPMLSFHTPTLWMDQKHNWGFLLRCDPGIVLSLPCNDEVSFRDCQGHTAYGQLIYKDVRLKNHGGKWFFWRVRYSLSARFNQFLVSLGWSRSDYNISYCWNNMFYQGRRIYGYDHYDKTDALFIAFSYCF